LFNGVLPVIYNELMFVKNTLKNLTGKNILLRKSVPCGFYVWIAAFLKNENYSFTG